MQLLHLDTLEQAQERLRTTVGATWAKIETRPLAKVRGYVLARDIFAEENVPGFDRSTVDGYAVLAADTAAAGESLPAFLHLIGNVDMGEPARFAISSGECAYVPTGAMLPAGANAVVMVEYCEQLGDKIAIGDAVSPGRNVVYRGEDMTSGNLVLSRGRILGPAEIGVFAALGITEIPAYMPPRIAVFSSGNEIIPLTKKPGPGQVRDINGPAITALAKQAGFMVVKTGILPDDEEFLKRTLRQAMLEHDIVVISGGSSQGQKDLTSRVIDDIAEPGLLTHGLAVKPGKPTILGFDEKTSTVLVGLPGHPVSAMMVFDAVLLSWWQSITGQIPSIPLRAELEKNLAAAPGKSTFQPVKLSCQQGKAFAEPLFYKSGLISTLAQADGFIILDRNQEGLPAGAEVAVHILRR